MLLPFIFVLDDETNQLNPDGKTVAAMDILVPKIGELIGGSQREDNLEVLESRAVACGMKASDIWWYSDLRRYGSVPHAGFGLGFERLVMFVTGLENIRDVIPFPQKFPHQTLGHGAAADISRADKEDGLQNSSSPE